MVCPVPGTVNNCISRDCEPGFSTRSKIGPISSKRKASSNPTAAIRSTDAPTGHQYGATYRMRRVSCRIRGSPGAATRAPLRMKSACVASFYSTHQSLAVFSRPRLPCHPSERRSAVEGPCVSSSAVARRTSDDQRLIYSGLSRCTTFTRYPAFRKRLLTSSAIITDRCWPPVQPKEIVR